MRPVENSGKVPYALFRLKSDILQGRYRKQPKQLKTQMVIILTMHIFEHFQYSILLCYSLCSNFTGNAEYLAIMKT